MKRKKRSRWNAALAAVRDSPFGRSPKIRAFLDELTEWQDEDRTYTTGERHRDRRLDCMVARLTAA